MPSRIIALVFIIGCHLSHAQNLVFNSGFEDTLSCPDLPYQIDQANGWNGWKSTADLFHRCSSTICDDGYYCTHVPNNIFGYQETDGDAYLGLQVYGNGELDEREVAGGQLIQPLTIGTTYYVSFKVSLVLDGYLGLHWSCNKLGIKFTTESYDTEINPVPIDNHAHIYSEEIIVDTVSWTTIEGTFVADSAYTHFGIGNFFSNEMVDTLHVNGDASTGVYFFVDDICVTANNNCDEVGLIEEGLSEPNVWFDGNSLVVHSDFPVGIEVYTLHGSLVFSNNISKNQHAISMDILSSGIYLVKILSSAGTIYKKVYKS